MNVSRRAYLVLVDPAHNKNKHYYLALVRDGRKYWVRTAWGRIGRTPQEKVAGRGAYIDYGDANNVFEGTLREKIGKGYRLSLAYPLDHPPWFQGPTASLLLQQLAVSQSAPVKPQQQKQQEEQPPKAAARPNAKWNF